MSRDAITNQSQQRTNGAAHVEPMQLANERNVGSSNQYGVSVPECNYTVWAHGDGDTVVSSVPALLFGIFCNTAITGASVVKNGTDATGDAVVTIPDSMAIGTYYELPGIKMNAGIFIDDASSAGDVVVLWRAQ